ncbi:hypothetical protein UlMin_032275 [Ulmus minor]
MVGTRKKSPQATTGTGGEIAIEGTAENGTAEGSSGYEQSRDLRIKENKERMQKLGLLDLSKKLKSEIAPKKRSFKPPSEKKTTQTLPQSPARRSSRLKTMAPVSYAEDRERKKGKRESSEDVEICLEEGSKPEIYTEEHEKLLGDCEMSWTLNADGYGEDGKRIYDKDNGETCHQCRQKTLGLHTHCSKCTIVQGQFCGDCLYARYGENVMEVNENPSWICPVCRDICNCSLCRKGKGWMPTGNLYRKVVKLGYKSVAHYLIQTKRSQPKAENPDVKVPAEESLPLVINVEDDTEESQLVDDNNSNDADDKAEDAVDGDVR